MRKTLTILLAGVAALGIAAPALAQSAPAACEREAMQKLVPADATVVSAARAGDGACRVDGYVITRDPGPNKVNFAIVMPERFNGTYLFLGVGGPAGVLPAFKPTLLAKGYALAGTDAGTGSKGGADYSFKSDPAKLLDFQWRGVHVSAGATQAIARGYYRAPRLTRLISGCSGGGAMAMTNAIRFGNADFDGFISAAVSWPGSAFKPNAYRITAYLQNNPQAWISPELLTKATDAIRERYDAVDGARDGLIMDARSIRFDDAVLRELGFTAAQIETFRMMTAPKPMAGKGIYRDGLIGGFPVTTMATWNRFFTGSKQGPWPTTKTHTAADISALGAPYYHVMADTNIRAQQPELDYTTITDVPRLVSLATLDGTENATSDLDFSKLAGTGAKMILWHGTHDEAASYLDNIKGYEAMLARNPTASEWSRFFAVPGMQHCAGGSGPTSVEEPMIEALASWVATGRAPESVVAARLGPNQAVERTFRICPEPTRAVLKGSGLDFTKAENWECRVPAST